MCTARTVTMLSDAMAVAAAYAVMTLLRFGSEVGRDAYRLWVPIAVAAHVLVACAVGLYDGKWRQGSFDETTALCVSVIAATTCLVLVDMLLGRPVPVRTVADGGTSALVLMAGRRYLTRVRHDRRLRPPSDARHRVIVFGAGEGGEQAIRAMLRNPIGDFFPVALLDDDRTKSRLRIMGVPVLGGTERLAEAVTRTRADTLLIAIPSAGSSLIRALSELAPSLSMQVKVLPPVAELPGGVIGVNDFRAITPSDFLGRREIDMAMDFGGAYLMSRRVLVTGAGGSIGSELCRQLFRLGPARLVMLDRDESALHAVQLSLEGRALLDSRNLVVADIRDERRLHAVFAEHRPEVVFHAAALKHLSLLEMYPSEAVKTNVWGTRNVLDVAVRGGVERFVNISTDKAADPTSVLGYSKRIGERLTAASAADAAGTLLSVRFGNVLGSRGSVLSVFRTQIEAGGPVTVTHPDVTRFFMTVEEAVRLVIQAAAIGRPGEALVLDMGEPVAIVEVAKRLIHGAGRPVDIVFSGLRPGEKMHETLFGCGEQDVRPAHPWISHVTVPPLVVSDLALLQGVSSEDELTAAMRQLCALPPLGCVTSSNTRVAQPSKQAGTAAAAV
jgi:FlaA1/EpsC-like NDP-sugar epimerase